MNNIKPSFTKQVWLFKLMVLPLAMSLAYFIVWNVTGDANIAMAATWIIGIGAVAGAGAFAGVVVFAVAGAGAFAIAVAFAFAVVGAFAFGVAGAGVFAIAIAVAFGVAFVGAVVSTGKDNKKWKISWFSNIISAILQFFLTWGGLYVAQHLQISFTWM